MPATTPGTASGPSSSVFIAPRSPSIRPKPRLMASAAAVPSGTPIAEAAKATCSEVTKPRANSRFSQALAYQRRVKPSGGKLTISWAKMLMTTTASTGARTSP